MNQFRDITMALLIALGIGLMISDPTTWRWADFAGPYVVSSLAFMASIHPFASVFCFALAGVLFMTRLKY